MIDAVDEFWLPNIGKYKEKEFKSITKGKVDLSKFENKKNDHKDKEFKSITKGKVDLSNFGSVNKKEKNNDKLKINNNINNLINVLKKELEDKISNVVVSNRLTRSPILLIADESGMDINMEKLMKIHNKTMPDNKKILEINPNHPMIIKLSNSLTKINHKQLSSLLLDQANILDGNVLSNPTNYIDSLTELFVNT